MVRWSSDPPDPTRQSLGLATTRDRSQAAEQGETRLPQEQLASPGESEIPGLDVMLRGA